MFTTYVKDDMFLGKTFYSLFFIPNQSNYILVYLMQSQNAIIYFDSMFCDEFIRGGSRTAALSNIERFVIKALHLGCCNSPKSALFVMMIFFFFFFLWLAGTILEGSLLCKLPTHEEKDINMCRTWVWLCWMTLCSINSHPTTAPRCYLIVNIR